MKDFGKIIAISLLIFIVACNGKKKDGGPVAGNHKPVINSVSLMPSNPIVQSEITAHILSSDQDADPITYTVKWFVNGRNIGEGMALHSEEIRKGDRVHAEITPHDGKEAGEPFTTSELEVVNTSPRIISVQLAPESVFVTTPQVVLSAAVDDPDRDSMRVIVHWVVGENVINDTSNVFRVQQHGLKKHDVVIGVAFVNDGEVRSEPFEFELHIANAPPTFRTVIDSVKCRSDSIYYPLPIFDPDSDPIDYELLNAPQGISIDRNNGVVYGNAGEVKTFEVSVRATDNEGAYIEARYTLTTP
ncbi:hypothetical protein A2Y85_00905 [candidate division WOR-3 bacterium RBG_13_43_14]|uniref:Ig-like domain-containing protein n=1 Tax=candidate division WOR-3 bacterium RBG_13_43_14 TaxID=1802590 RepID=A0A1F4UB20_UNCW3|nr:MAG: hypothetical protein A2Y85_00905 [candidate division WOR-3 bacterium RBG_13_43_14]